MIVDAETYDLVNAIEQPARARRRDGEIKPELMESVLEISTDPCATPRRRASSCARCAAASRAGAGEHGLAIGSAGTHPFALWEDQRIVGRTRYRDLVSALRFVARQELIFGMHVHVGVDDPDKAIHVANGMRVHLPVLLALSANSPFWRADQTGLESTRTPIFRAFPRVGIPPAYRRLGGLQRQIDFMVAQRGHRGLHVPLVRRPPAPALRDGRDARVRLPDAHRAHARPGRAHPGDGQASCASTSRQAGTSASTPGRCSTRTSGSPPATGSTASSSTCRPPSGSHEGARAAPRRPPARARAGPRLGRRSGRRRPTSRARKRRRRASSSSTRPTTISPR